MIASSSPRATASAMGCSGRIFWQPPLRHHRAHARPVVRCLAPPGPLGPLYRHQWTTSPSAPRPWTRTSAYPLVGSAPARVYAQPRGHGGRELRPRHDLVGHASGSPPPTCADRTDRCLGRRRSGGEPVGATPAGGVRAVVPAGAGGGGGSALFRNSSRPTRSTEAAPAGGVRTVPGVTERGGTVIVVTSKLGAWLSSTSITPDSSLTNSMETGSGPARPHAHRGGAKIYVGSLRPSAPPAPPGRAAGVTTGSNGRGAARGRPTRACPICGFPSGWHGWVNRCATPKPVRDSLGRTTLSVTGVRGLRCPRVE